MLSVILWSSGVLESIWIVFKVFTQQSQTIAGIVQCPREVMDERWTLVVFVADLRIKRPVCIQSVARHLSSSGCGKITISDKPS